MESQRYLAQKGTIGITIPQADMPFSERGISPDLIVNPNAIPSRMTVGQFVECLTGKVGAIKGEEVDGTPFNEIDIAEVKKELESLGYYDDGTEELYNGMSGKKMKVRIFIGPTYYMRLKHMVSDKMHCLTMDHEVLTESGWKTFHQVTDSDKLYTMNIETKETSYEKPIEKHFYENRLCQLYAIKNSYIDTIVTEGHKFPVRVNGSDKIVLVTVSDMFNNINDTKFELYSGTYVNNLELDANHITNLDMQSATTFCFSMPDETFYVRRNGHEFWTGNSRARGPRTLLTRQAPEGRSRDGGLRVGEMERDTIIAHGMSMFLKERLLETADAYTTYVCDKCGMFAQRMLKKDQPIHPTKYDVYHCPSCKNKTEISKIMIPYAFKLLLQELMAMNVLPRIRIKKNRYSQF